MEVNRKHECIAISDSITSHNIALASASTFCKDSKVYHISDPVCVTSRCEARNDECRPCRNLGCSPYDCVAEALTATIVSVLNDLRTSNCANHMSHQRQAAEMLPSCSNMHKFETRGIMR